MDCVMQESLLSVLHRAEEGVVWRKSVREGLLSDVKYTAPLSCVWEVQQAVQS